MKPFFDSSALAKRYIDEVGSDLVEMLCAEADEISISALAECEILSALARRLLEKQINKTEHAKAVTLLAAETNAMRKVHVDHRLLKTVKQLVTENTIRTLDAIHLAAALLITPDVFVTSDKRQAAVAKKLQLKVKLV